MRVHTFTVNVIVERVHPLDGESEGLRNAEGQNVDPAHAQHPCVAAMGYIDHTSAEDGRPQRVVVITSHPAVPGGVMETYIVGALRCDAETGDGQSYLLGTAADDTVVATMINEDRGSQLVLHEVWRRLGLETCIDSDTSNTEAWVGPADAERMVHESIARYRR